MVEGSHWFVEDVLRQLVSLVVATKLGGKVIGHVLQVALRCQLLELVLEGLLLFVELLSDSRGGFRLRLLLSRRVLLVFVFLATASLFFPDSSVGGDGLRGRVGLPYSFAAFLALGAGLVGF